MFLLPISLSLALAYDYNLLAVEWKPSNCLKSSDRCPKEYKTNNFGIHGLWPSNNDGTWPEYCYDINPNPYEINDEVQALLERHWQSYKKNQTWFWEHEWKRHGNCFEPAHTAPDFFTLSVNLFINLKLEESLASVGVEPSNTKTYSVDEISSAFSKKVNVNCKNVNKKYYLGGINLCFDRSLKLKDCSFDKRKKCGSEIHYPVIERSGDL